MPLLDLYRPYIELPDAIDGKFVTIHCPFVDNHKHGDKKASASIAVDSGVFVCAVCGTKSPEKFIQELLNVSILDAVSIVRDYKHINSLQDDACKFVDTPVYNPAYETLIIKAKQNLTRDNALVQCFLESRGLQYETLEKYEVGYLPAKDTFWKRDSLVFPYRFGGRIVGIRYRDILGSKGSEPNCTLTIWGVDTLENNPPLAVLCEGESDRLRAAEALDPAGIPAVSAPTGAFTARWVREFDGVKQIILISDCDKAGIGMEKQAIECLRDRLTVVRLPWGRREFGKDVCDWLLLHTEEEFVNLIQTHKQKRPLGPISSDELCEVNENERWLITNLIARGQVGVVAGQPKAGKTWVALNIVKCLLERNSQFCELDIKNENDEPLLVSCCEPPNILFVEEEGNLGELKARANQTLRNTPEWKKHVFWWHKSGTKLDDLESVNTLNRYITERNIGVLILDPMQCLHLQDENDAGRMGLVWYGLHELTRKNPDLSIITLHHFKKEGDLGDKWNALRGSSRTAAEVDWGIFIKKRPKNEAKGMRIAFDGRSIVSIETPDGKDEFRLLFDDGILTVDNSILTISKHESLIMEMQYRKIWPLKDAQSHYSVSHTTLKTWIDKTDGVVIIDKPGPGKPALLLYKGVDDE